MHVVGAYARAGFAAVVIEDKTFRKDTSLLAGGRQDTSSGSRNSRARSRRRVLRAMSATCW
jgi:hypothetical protein